MLALRRQTIAKIDVSARESVELAAAIAQGIAEATPETRADEVWEVNAALQRLGAPPKVAIESECRNYL
jgi:hypothetical protein